MTYRAQVVPVEIEQLSEFIEDQLREVETNFDLIDNVTLNELNVAPVKPRTGMIVLADGTNWDPGSGAGFYGYRGGAWVLLG